MKIKNKFLNEETLKPYGFEKLEKFNLFSDVRFVEYWKKGEYTSIFIHPSGEISVFIKRPYTTVLIDDIVYQLIMNNLVEV